MYRTWSSFSDKANEGYRKLAKDGSKRYKDLYDQWSEYAKRMSGLAADFTPEDNDVFKDMWDVWTDYSMHMGKEFFDIDTKDKEEDKDTKRELNEVWSDYSQSMGDWFSRALGGQMPVQKELYDVWVDAFGMKDQPHFKAPSSVLDATKKYWEEAMTRTPFPSMGKGGVSYGDYKELHDRWLKTYPEFVVNLMASEAIASMNGITLDGNLESMRVNQAIMKDYLSGLGMPTKESVDEIYHKLYEVDKRMREITRTLKTIEKALNRE